MNRLGDIFLLISILFSNLLFNSTDFNIINYFPPFNTDLFIFFFFFAAMAKSAQLYLHL
jgi:NADH:ubiquinone oxidoreductase subunit 5 (subunit L)/multisubunit Na+/H+ antiporter MnhA subunit